MKALVIGSTGFIGSYLVRNLLSKKMDVRALARNPGQVNFPSEVEVVRGDILDMGSLGRAVEGTDMVFNLAGALGAQGVPEGVMWKVNKDGAANVAQVCKENSTRLIHCSSTGVYGYVNSNVAVEEDYPPNPQSSYQKSKWEGEKLAVEAAGKLTTVVRPSLVYGPGDNSNLIKFYQTIYSGKFMLIGDGQNLVSPVYVEDVAEGICLASKEKAMGKAYNLSCSEPITMERFTKVISTEFGRKLPRTKLPLLVARAASVFGFLNNFGIPFPVTKDRVEFLTSSLVYSIEKAQKELGYSPKTGIEEGMKRTISWCREERYI